MMKKPYVLFLILPLLLVFLSITHSVWGQYKTSSNKVTTKVGEVKVPSTSGNHPVAPTTPSDIRAAIIDKWGITLDGFPQDKLEYAWDKFWDISNTNFLGLVRNTSIIIHDDTSVQAECQLIKLRRGLVVDANRELFDVVLIHELSHIIRNCVDDGTDSGYSSFRGVHEEVFKSDTFNGNQGVTEYGQHPCYGTSQQSEDYAEMIAYYLNPGVIEQTACESRGVIPYANGHYKGHYDLAKRILGDY